MKLLPSILYLLIFTMFIFLIHNYNKKETQSIVIFIPLNGKPMNRYTDQWAGATQAIIDSQKGDQKFNIVAMHYNIELDKDEEISESDRNYIKTLNNRLREPKYTHIFGPAWSSHTTSAQALGLFEDLPKPLLISATKNELKSNKCFTMSTSMNEGITTAICESIVKSDTLSIGIYYDRTNKNSISLMNNLKKALNDKSQIIDIEWSINLNDGVKEKKFTHVILIGNPNHFFLNQYDIESLAKADRETKIILADAMATNRMVNELSTLFQVYYVSVNTSNGYTNPHFYWGDLTYKCTSNIIKDNKITPTSFTLKAYSKK